MNLQSVGQSHSDPNDELRLAIEQNNGLRQTLKAMRTAYDTRRLKELDTELKNAWMINEELGRRLRAVTIQAVAQVES